MSARKLLAVFLTLAVVAVAVVVTTGPGDAPPPAFEPRSTADGGQSASRVATAATGEQAESATEPDDESEQVRAEVEAVANQPEELGENEALVRGRCVDERGAPLAGVTVELDGWTGNSERMARFELDGGEITWEDPEDFVTGPDGRFEFRIEPPPPYQFSVDLETEGRVAMRFRWHELPVGEVREVGDVLLPLGVAVSGRVVSPDGAGLGDARVQAMPEREGRGEPYPVSYVYRTADAGGYFSFDALPEGRVRFRAHRLNTIEPKAAVSLERPSQDVRIVAIPKEAASGPSIDGVVVDEFGAPMPGVNLHVGELDAFLSSPDGRSGRDGRFSVRLAEGAEAGQPTLLHAVRHGYEIWHSPEPLAWDTDGHRVVMRSGPPVSLRVTSAPDGEPVERYGITLSPVREHGGWSSSDDDLLHFGAHPDGLLQIDRVTPGKHRLGVQAPADAELEMVGRIDIEVVAGRPLDLEVRLQRVVERTVEVVTADGSPVAGAPVELLAHQRDGEVTMEMIAMDRRGARMNSPDHVAVLLAEGTTDTAGEVRVEGASGTDLALRLPGPGTVPKLVQPVRLDEDVPLRVVVSRGATLRGRLGPVEVLEQLRAEARPEEPVSRPGREEPKFGIYLSRADGDTRRFPGGRVGSRHVPVAEDGRFEVIGIPPGTWDLHLMWERVSMNPGGRPSQTSTVNRQIEDAIALTDGQELDVEVDLSLLRRHPVPVRSSVGGVARAMMVRLHGEVGVDSNGRTQRSQLSVVTGEDGRVTAHLPAGSWRAIGQLEVDDVRVGLPGPTFEVPGTPEAGIVIDAVLGRRNVQVLRPDGEPAQDIKLDTAPRPNDPRPSFAAVATDHEGRTTLHAVIGSYPLGVRRQPLNDWSKLFAWQRANPGVERRQAWVDLGEIELLPGATDEVVIRLPQEWLELPK